MSEIVHFTGQQVQIGNRLRQRCSWCGLVLIDYDLTRIAVPGGTNPRPPMWEVGRLVSVDGGCSVLLPDTDKLPAGSCADIDDDVTGLVQTT